MKLKAGAAFLAIVLVVLGSWAACSMTDSRGDASPSTASIQVRADHVALPEELPVIPDAYRDVIYRAGTLEQFDYRAADPNDPARTMHKHAVVYLPYGYDEEGSDRYDIVYLMHGMSGDAEKQLGSPEAPNGTKRMLDNLIANGDMEPMIVVALSYYPDNKNQESDDYDAKLTLDFGDELRDLMPALESRYRTYAEDATPQGFTSSRAHRAFGGFSMGAVTTWYRACDTMDWFKYYIPVSGSLLWGVDYASPFWTAKKAARQIAEAVDEQGYGPGDFFVFTAAGSEDFGLEVVEEQTGALGRLGYPFMLDDAAGNANIVYLVADGEGHNYACYARVLYTALPHISAMMHAGDTQ